MGDAEAGEETGGVPSPRAPFDRWPLHLFDPSYGHCWWVADAAAIVTQTICTYGHAEGAAHMSDWVDACLAHEKPALEAAGGLLILHDWRSLQAYDSKSRVLINDRMKRRPKGYARRTMCVVRPTPLWRMALTVTDLTYALLNIPPAVMGGDMARALATLQGTTPGPAPAWLRACTPG